MERSRSLTESGQSVRDGPPSPGPGTGVPPHASLSPLDQIGWLAAQPAPFRDWAQRSGRWRLFAKGQSLYQVGEEPEAMYGLGAGALDVLIPVSDDDQVTIHRAEPGFWVGDSGLLAGSRRVISVLAATPCRVFSIPAGAVRRVVEERPDFWRCFYELAHRNGTLAVATLAEVLARSPEARLARMLLRLADGDGHVEATQADLARLLGVTRSSLQRALSRLMVEAGVQPGYGVIVVPDRASLERIVDAG